MQDTKFIALLLLTFCFTITSWAQPNKKIDYKTYIPDSVKIINLQEPKTRIKYDKPFRNELSLGFRLPYRGWGFFVDYTLLRRKESYKKFEYDYMYQGYSIALELGERFHAKEEKPGMLTSLLSQPALYTPGKINNFYHAKLIFSNKMLLAGKQNKGNIGVHWIMGLGAVIGIQKPYYITVPNMGSIRYTDSTKAEFLNGFASGREYFKGLNEIEIIPGVLVKSGFQFDIARQYKKLSIIEVGGTLEYFFNDVSLMAEQKPQKLFAGVYLSYQFGRRR